MDLSAHNVRPAIMRRLGRADGGKVDTAAKDVHKHETHLHPGKPKTKLKDGGSAPGKEPAVRMDKKPRKAGGGEVYKAEDKHKTLHPAMTTTNVDKIPQNRAHGGRTGGKKHGKTQIIIHAGGGQQQDPMALQQAKQQGMQEGAMKVMGALKAKAQQAQAMGGGMGPAGAPPGMGGAPPPSPGGAPPPMAGPPPMRKDGGSVKDDMVEVKAHQRRRGGACE